MIKRKDKETASDSMFTSPRSVYELLLKTPWRFITLAALFAVSLSALTAAAVLASFGMLDFLSGVTLITLGLTLGAPSASMVFSEMAHG